MKDGVTVDSRRGRQSVQDTFPQNRDLRDTHQYGNTASYYTPYEQGQTFGHGDGMYREAPPLPALSENVLQGPRERTPSPPRPPRAVEPEPAPGPRGPSPQPPGPALPPSAEESLLERICTAIDRQSDLLGMARNPDRSEAGIVKWFGRYARYYATATKSVPDAVRLLLGSMDQLQD